MAIHSAHRESTTRLRPGTTRAVAVASLLLGGLLWAPADAAAEQRGQVVYADVPSELQAGQSAPVIVTYRNTGTTTWSESTLHRLGALSGANEVEWFGWKCGGYSNSVTDQRAKLCQDVPPGGTHEFRFSIRVPAGASGTVRLSVKMVQDGVEWFDWFGSWDIDVTGSGTDNDAEVLGSESDVPDSLEPGESESVRIRVRNTGTTTWRAGTNHRLGAEFEGSRNEVLWSGFECGGYMNSPTDARAYLCHDVAPGATHDFRFDVEMPSGASGSRRLAVRTVQDGIEWFGSSRSWGIDVDDPPPPTCANDPLATPSDRWKLEIWDNPDFAGATVEQRYDAAGGGGFAFDWGNGGPSTCGSTDRFAVRFSRRVGLPDSATYTFTTTTDDGVRLWVDGVLVIDRWHDQSRTSHTASLALSEGWHDLRMDSYDNTGQAYAGLSWVANVPQGACPPGTIDLADYLLGSPEVRIHIRHESDRADEHFAYRTGGTVERQRVDGNGAQTLDRHYLIKTEDGVSWEEFGVDDDYIYRNRDTSWSALCNDGSPAYYQLREEGWDSYARLAPRCMAIPQAWTSDVQTYVDGGFRTPDRCDYGCTNEHSEAFVTLEAALIARHEQFTTSPGGVAIHELPGNPDVIEFETSPFGDRFWFARGIGMIQFTGPDPANPSVPFRSGAYQIDFDQPPANFVGLCGEEIAQRSFHVDPGSTAALVANVPGGQGQATFSTTWPGSDVATTLTSPSGRVIGRTTVAPDLVHRVGPTSEEYTLQDPQPGAWQVSLYGADLPPGGEEVGFSLSTIAAAPPDTTPPVITPSVTGTPGANGWYVSAAGVTWSVLDPESGVPLFSGCQPRTVGDTPGTTITCTATNGAGLTRSVSVTVKVDTTPPQAALVFVSGTPGANGWYVSDVVVRTQGADPTSGIASCTPDQPLVAETTGTILQGSCVNGAGLTAAAAPLTVRIDKTPPVLTAARSPQPNAAGWNNTDVTVTFACHDAVSGVSEPPSSPQVVTTEGAGQSANAVCVDAAGHAATATVDGIAIDKTAPAVVVSSPEAGEYLREARLPMSWTVNESLSGLDSETGRLDRRTVANAEVVSLKSVGKGSHTLEVVAVDVAGNSGTATVAFRVLQSLPRARHVDWPLGTCTGAELVLGLEVDVVQDYGNATHPLNGPQAHAGLDLKLREGSTARAPVYAAADGVFECSNSEPGDARPDYPGRALVLKHKLADAGTVYTQYGHLEDVRVGPGRVVRRGDLVGHVLDQDAAGDTHLHFEVRKFAHWEKDDCAGPGYAPAGSTPKQHRWLDPVPFHYTHRPSHPAAAVTWSDPEPLPLRARPRADGTPLGSVPPSSRLSVLDVVKDESCRNEEKCSDWWYKLRDASGRRVFLSGFRKGDYGSALTVGEPRRTGALWSASSRRPLVDYGFDDPVDFAQGVVTNRARPGRRDGRILGDAGLVDGQGGGDDEALRLDGATAYVEVEDSRHLRFRDGIELEALVSRESASTEDAIAGQGGPDGPWRLAFSPEGTLAFELRFEDGKHARLEHRVSACDDLGVWVHVAARYDPDDGIRLFWNGSQVAKDGAHGKRLAGAKEPIRIGDAGGEPTRFHGAIDAVRIRELRRAHDDGDDDHHDDDREDDDDDDDGHDRDDEEDCDDDDR